MFHFTPQHVPPVAEAVIWSIRVASAASHPEPSIRYLIHSFSMIYGIRQLLQQNAN